MKRFSELVKECARTIIEIFPWDLAEALQGREILLLDVREPQEFAAMHIAGSLHIPRGILESACEYGYEDTVPELAAAREREIVVICRSGNRSALAAQTLQRMGFRNVASLKNRPAWLE